MTLQEFSNGFDYLYNNIASNQAPGLTQDEKTFFLNMAQQELVEAAINKRMTKTFEGFDDQQKQALITRLITNYEVTLQTSTSVTSMNGSYSGQLPLDIIKVLSEHAKVSGNTKRWFPVYRLTFDEFISVSSKPSCRPPKNMVWCLPIKGALDSTTQLGEWCEYLGQPNEVLSSVVLKYIKMPRPIILKDVEPGFEFGGWTVIEDGTPAGTNEVNTSNGLNCLLDTVFHDKILRRAVELAKASYNGGLQEMIGVGGESATFMRPIPTMPNDPQR